MAFFGSSPAKSGSPSFGGASASGSSSFGSARKTGADFFGSSQNSSTPSFSAPPEQSEAPTFGTPPEQSGAPNFSSAPQAGSDFFGDEPTKTADTPFFLISFFIPEQFEVFGAPASINDSEGNRTPIELVTGGGEDVVEIAAFAGVDPDSIRALIQQNNPTNGSVVKLTFPASTDPQSVTFFYEFQTGEDAESSYNDFSFFATSDGQVELLADTTNASSNSTGQIEVTLTIDESKGEVIVYLGVLNARDTLVDSFLRVGVEQDGASSLVLLPVTEVGVALTGLPEPAVGSSYFGEGVIT